jgi:hypothetical protein
MSRSIWSGCLILALAALVVGCGPPEEDRLMTEKIAVMNQISESFEKVTDKKGFAESSKEIVPLLAKLSELEKKLTELGPERSEAALKRNVIDFERAKNRMSAARAAAGAKARG